MKKFQLVIKDGRRTIYKSIFSFSEEQEKEYLEKISSEGEWDSFGSELEAVVVRDIGEKKWSKDYNKWNSMTRKECVEHYPDYAIAAHIMNELYDRVKADQNFDDLDVPSGVHEEILIANLPMLDWYCKRIS